ncbi:MAG TPA: preprotein translocase subunit Sec61beta [archaeon]|nr:preprotein translocase subunit Sec61beta [archaeon]
MTKSKDKVYMPMGAGGLVRYTEEGKAWIKFKPMHIVYGVIGLVVFEVLLKIFIPL